MSLDLSMMDTKYRNILEQSEIYVLSFPNNRKYFNLSSFVPKKKINLFSSLDEYDQNFIEYLYYLDQLNFGPSSMAMERWVAFDCAQMPSALVGLGIKKENASQEILERFSHLNLPTPSLIPISMFVAIPMVGGKSWFAHNLSSGNKSLELNMPGLALLTKVIGIKIFNANELYGATQWGHVSLNIHAQLADLELMSAYTPAHSYPYSLTYKSHYNDKKLYEALNGNPRVVVDCKDYLEADNHEEIKRINQMIKNGINVSIIGRPISKGEKDLYPLRIDQI